MAWKDEMKERIRTGKSAGREMVMELTIIVSIIYLLFKTGNIRFAWVTIAIFAFVLIWEAIEDVFKKK